VGVTIFEQAFCAKNGAMRSTTAVLRPPSSRSARVAANRVSLYSQLPAKGDSETHNLFEGIRGSASAQLGDVQDVHKRLKKLEEEISSVQDMLREVLSKL
jgi:hypothetical protein